MAFFRGAGRVIGRALNLIKAIVPEEDLLRAIDLVRAAANKFVDNETRRTWVIAELMKLPWMRESLARLLVELALQHLKRGVIDRATEEAIERVKAGADDE